MSRQRVVIEALFSPGCGSRDGVMALIRELAAGLPDAVAIRERCIASVEEARQARFLGSPSIRVNGVDVEPAARERTD
ncbi:MAG: hypothetical protein AB1634_13190 [Thermodesulfobacteriota bacterium]